MDERTVTPQIRTFFWGAGTAFAGLAGVVLFLFPDKSDRLFAWTIVRGDTAAFLGACFLAIALESLLCYGVPTWGGVRVCFAGTLAFVTAMTLATLLHLDQFHYGSDEPVALVAAWVWTLVYLAAPVAGAVLYARQRRQPPLRRSVSDPDQAVPDQADPDQADPDQADPEQLDSDHADPRPARRRRSATTPIVPGLRYLYLAQGALLTVVAVVLFLAPGSADTLWPWPLGPLPARAVASFLLGLGVMLFGAGRDNAAERLEPPCAAAWWLAVLTGMAVTRFDGSVEVGSVQGLVFCVVAISLLVGGLAGEMAARRLRPAAAA